MTISIIAAIGPNRELGKDNQLLWHIPEDMKRFKELTNGHAVIMGRKTFESIGKPLPNRVNIVITRDVEGFKNKYQIHFRHSGKRPNESEGAHPESDSGQARMTSLAVVSSLDEAIRTVKSLNTKYLLLNTDEVFVIGGGQIYEQAIKIADKLYLTIVEPNNSFDKIDADTFFPDYSEFNKTISIESLITEKYKLTFLELERAS